MEHGVRSASLLPSDFPPQKLSRQLDFVSSVNSSRASSISTPLKPDSPRSWTLPSFEVKNSTPKKTKQCNCKNSQCLKLYCECFALNVYCNGCNCANCHNVENDPARKDAIEALLDRNPNAFRPKIDSSPQAVRDKREEAGEPLLVVKHNKGCNCKKSGCLKKYCECYQAGILCSENCKCLDCKNFEGSEDRKTLCNGDHGNPLIYIDQTANAAINGAIGSSGWVSPESKKRKTYDLLFGTVENYQPFHRHAQLSQANHLNTAQPASFTGIPVARAITPPLQSKLSYRSPLTDIIQPETVKELCKSLVIASAQTAKTFADKKKSQDKKLGEERPPQKECSLSSSHVEDELLGEENFKATSADDCSRGTHTVKSRTEELGSDSADVDTSRRPLSPGTMALMCDEQDTMFMKSPCNFKAASADDCSRGTHTVESHTEELGSDSADVDISRRPLSPGTMALMCDEHDTMFMKSPSNFARSTQSESQDMSDVYAEQERCILMKFRDTLLNLVNCARMKDAASALTNNHLPMSSPPRWKRRSLMTGSSQLYRAEKLV